MREILLTQGMFALVDDEDYEWLIKSNWFYHPPYKNNPRYTGYAVSNLRIDTNKWTRLSMHRAIMDAPRGLVVDHIDGNGLNNQKSNLRLCTRSENQRNSQAEVGGTSIYKGVYWSRERNCWVSVISLDKFTNLGFYDKEEDAAWAYNQAAIQHYGEFARLNEVPDWADGSSRRTAKSKSGIPGICYHKQAGGWMAYAKLGGKNTYIGYFKTQEEAVEAQHLALSLVSIKERL